jgi:hypothetical protein
MKTVGIDKKHKSLWPTRALICPFTPKPGANGGLNGARSLDGHREFEKDYAIRRSETVLKHAFLTYSFCLLKSVAHRDGSLIHSAAEPLRALG